ncbi:MAG: bifunctional adenosylcobinamide kinase/adenosylcobinamide-phosphate guanylyltransferase [Polyangiales bacterium]
MIHLVLGGARSGKSRHAQQAALALTDAPVYVATSRRWDDDHAARIERHKSDRGIEWTTIEDERTLAHVTLKGRVVVIDCLTLWLTNLFLDQQQHVDAVREAARAEIDRVAAIDATWILVSNEIGLAPHAMTESGRKFVDLQGFVNQDVAARASTVTLMVAGLPLHVRGHGIVALPALASLP